jgi:hypothetical protein
MEKVMKKAFRVKAFFFLMKRKKKKPDATRKAIGKVFAELLLQINGEISKTTESFCSLW